MTTPAVKVEIAFGLNASMGDYFLLDSPSRGLLDTGTLGPDTTWSDVTDTVLGRSGLSCKRGRERYSDEPQGGTAQFTLNNRDRRYDPTVEIVGSDDAYDDIYTDVYGGVAAPYFGQLVPMRRVRITAVWEDGTAQHIWSGFVDQWPVDYTAGDTEVSVPCVDALAVLADSELDERLAANAGDLPYQRITRALDEASFPPTYQLDDGVETLAATTYGENALAFVKRVVLSDAGRLYVSAGGTLTFKDRANFQPSPAVQLGGDIPLHHVEVDTSADQLWNRIVVQLEDGTEVSAADPDSQADYLTRTRTFSNLMLASSARANEYAQIMLGRFARPKPRISQVTVRLAALTVDQQRQVLGLEVGDLVGVEFTPTFGGAPSSVVQDGTVEGVSVKVGAGADWQVTLSVSSTDATPYLRLDDVFFGQLDENVVAF